MKKFFFAGFGLLLFVLFTSPSEAIDLEARFVPGIEGGIFQPSGTDQKIDPGDNRGLSFKYGLSERVSIGALAKVNYAWGTEKDTFDYKYRNIILETALYYYFSPDDEKMSPFIFGGGGISFWKYKDKAGNQVYSNKFGVLNREDLTAFGLHDQELSLVFGGGLEYSLIENVGITLGARFHFLTRILTDLTGPKDVVGSGKGKLDVPRGIPELFCGVSYYLGRGKDQDRDGVKDRFDQCPDTPEGALVDEFGCPMDQDKDGVYDGLDSCAGTPEGAMVDAFGCPIDKDKDGVYDGIDKCDNTPEGVKVDPYGCPVDTDKDGVPDYLDYEVNTPSGAKVDEDGKGIDSDEDGIYDGLDKCPDTPFGIEVDEVGCPLVKPIEEKIMLHIKYPPGGVALDEPSKKILDDLAERLKVYKDVEIEIQGYTDSFGSSQANKVISQRRADQVKKYLVAKEVEDKRIIAKGYGATNFIADNDTKEGREKNRRIEIVRIK